MTTLTEKLTWTAVALAGAVAFAVVALTRGEPVNAAWLVVAVGLHLFHRLPVLRAVHRHQSVRRRSEARHAGLPPQRRARLRPDQPLRAVRPPFRRHRRRRAAGRAGARGADGLSARHAVDSRGRGVRRRGAGHDGAVPVDAAGRPLARRDDPHGDRPGRRQHRRRRHPADLHHPARRAGAGGGQCAEGQPVGRLHGVLHHPDRADHGRLQPLHPPRPDRRDVADRRRAAAGGARSTARRCRRRRRSRPGSR